jgi:hypothetical protein
MVDPPYRFIADGLKAGEVVPFFGAAASAVYRPQNERWEPGKPFMPFGGELAVSLATAASYPAGDEAFTSALDDVMRAIGAIGCQVPAEEAKEKLTPVLRRHIGSSPNLAVIASWAEHVQGNRRAVDRELRQSFAVECKPGLLHTKLANVEETRIYITTNYDDLLESALAPRQPHVLVDRGDKGLWVSVAGAPFKQVAATGDELYDLLDDRDTQQPSRPILFKMHGSIDKLNARNDCYLITEEDYVDFLGRSGGSYLPPYVNGLLEGKDFLFLGYSLEDWNIRVILRKLLKRTRDAKDKEAQVRFWAIVRGRSDVEQQVWQARELNIYPMELCTFAEKLANFFYERRAGRSQGVPLCRP